MDYKRVLTIQDISCVGQCSLTVALPILSACGHETCILPSAVLSTHTGGEFHGFTFRDLTEDIPAIQKNWLEQNITFDAIYTGYLGSAKQIDYVLDIFNTLLRSGGKVVVDPAMADCGQLYVGFDMAFVKKMGELCRAADVILPNITEAAFLTGLPFKETYDERYIQTLLDALTENGAKSVILTGVSYDPDETGVVVFENGKSCYYRHRKIRRGFHGTGDVYASSFVGAWLAGHDKFDAAQIAADFTVASIMQTVDDEKHWYGVKFEKALPELIRKLQ